MLDRRSQNLELIPLDPDLERNLRRTRRAPVKRETVEMGDDLSNANQEEHMEYQDARAGNEEQARAWNVDFTTLLRELFALVANSSHS